LLCYKITNMSSATFYAVARGVTPGIYETWSDTKDQVDKYPGAIYQRFSSREEAAAYLDSKKEEAPCSRIPTLTDEQQAVLQYLLEGRNVFLTGGGGVGKSYLLSVMETEFPGLKRRTGGISKLPRVQLCALTGCAALLLGQKAKTLHSWAGIGLGKGTIQELVTKIRRNQKAMRHWLCTDLLVIDEISMMTAELLDKLNGIGKKLRSNQQPFGGMQVLLVGDFYQLPPVYKNGEATVFAFESAAWKEAIHVNMELTIIQRQKDVEFQAILKEARMGALSKQSCAIIRAREGLDWKQNKILPTLLFPRRSEVDMINEANLRALSGRRYTYEARLAYDGKMPDRFSEKEEGFIKALQHFDANAAYAISLELMLGAQVMLIANLDPASGLVNGSRGVVVSFCSATDMPVIEFVNGSRRLIGTHSWPIEDYEFVSRTQIPLRLAWAYTTHKAQGATLDTALIDVGSGNFEFGQAYVALARARSLEGLYIYDFDPVAFKAHPNVKDFYQRIQWSPIVALELPDAEESDKPIVSVLAPVERVIHVHKLAEEQEPGSSVATISEATISVATISEATISEATISEATISEAKSVEATTNWLYDSVPHGWKASLAPCESTLQNLSTFLDTKTFLPARTDIWAALAHTPLESVRVVILGQDPYPTPGHAHGLAFSVQPDVRPLPRSLSNIYKELQFDLGITPGTHGSLVSWSQQGVLLLNTVLTVEAHAAQSHAKIGWEEITDQIIRSIAAQTKHVVFVLWGKSAQVKKKLLAMYLDMNQHRVFESAHPSPLSAKKFFGTRPFSTVNRWLEEMGKAPIDWTIPV
jgi:ATP-dependent DNA helicase PIF1